MKEFFNNKRNIVISVVSLVLVVAIVIVAVTFNNNKVDVDNSTTQNTTESKDTNTDGTVTEKSTEKVDTETSTTTTESTTKPETTTKKPNKTETTTKKPVTTTKPSKPETTTKASEKVTANPNDLSNAELEQIWRENFIDGEVVTSEEEYNYYINTYVPNYKCIYCGEHSCPSINYRKNRLGDTVVGIIDEYKCPAIKAEKVKCDVCGKILVDVGDDRFYNQPDKYCDGWCDFGFN